MKLFIYWWFWDNKKWDYPCFQIVTVISLSNGSVHTAQKMKFSIKEIFSISWMGNFIFCAVSFKFHQIWIVLKYIEPVMKGRFGSKQKMVASKSYYLYWDVSCNNKNMRNRIIYVFIAFFPCLKAHSKVWDNFWHLEAL